MEKAAGVPLYERWRSMTEFERLQLIKNLTKLEAQLSAISFPAYGGLYLRTDMSRPNRSLGDEIDPSKSFCIGPSCDKKFIPDTTLEFDQGPCALPIQPGSSPTNISQGIQFQAWEYPLHGVNCFEYQEANKADRAFTKEPLNNKPSSWKSQRTS